MSEKKIDKLIIREIRSFSYSKLSLQNGCQQWQSFLLQEKEQTCLNKKQSIARDADAKSEPMTGDQQ